MTEAERKTAESPYFLQMPEGACGPLFLDSPHSCTTYPADFRFAAGLPLPCPLSLNVIITPHVLNES